MSTVMKGSAIAVCLASLVLGCGKGDGPLAETSSVVVTNVVTVTREVVVTNVVTRTETVTNVVVERREPERLLSARRTAPYLVSAGALDALRLRKLLSDAGVRVISSEDGAVATVEASDRAVQKLSGVVTAKPLTVSDKVDGSAGEDVRIVPLSVIDTTAVAAAVRELGGEIVEVVAEGRPAVRAKMSKETICKLAERGDVRRIERDRK